MSEEVIKVVNFDGFISHVSESGEDSEVIIYVSHVVSDDTPMPRRHQHDLTPTNGTAIVNDTDTDYGKVFTIRVGQCVERVAAKNISENERLTMVHLLDKGIDVEVERNALFPSTSEAKMDIDCICPVLVVDAGEEQRKVATQITGRECRCISGNLVVIPSVGLCVKGRLLISYENGGYAELKDISLVPAEGQECTKFVVENLPAQSSGGDIPPRSQHERPIRYRHGQNIRCRRGNCFDERYAQKNGNNGTAEEMHGNETDTFTDSYAANHCNRNHIDENSSVVENSNVRCNAWNRRGGVHGVTVNYRYVGGDDTYAVIPKPHMPFKQSAFKEFVPHIYPRSVRVRFDKADPPPMDTFWAFDPNIFTTIERILHESRQHYSAFPHFDVSMLHELNGVGCLVRASVDSGCRSLCRAEIIKFADITHKFSVYLVDYGFYKWIRCNDVLNISSINKKDKILSLPVALFHCRLEKAAGGNTIRLQQFEKGGEYEITIKSRDAEGIFNVHVDRVDYTTGDALTNVHKSLMPVPADESTAQNESFAPWCSFSSLRYTNETLGKTFERNIGIDETMRANPLTSTMMENNMNFNGWFGFPCPMVMPIMMPVMPNFGGLTANNQTSQVSAHLGQGDPGDVPVALDGSIRNANEGREDDRSWGYGEGGYRSCERSGYGDDFGSDEQDTGDGNGSQACSTSDRSDKRNSNHWGGGWQRGGANKGRRAGKCTFCGNISGCEAADMNFSVDTPGFVSARKENKKRGHPVASAGSSEWDLPPPRNQRINIDSMVLIKSGSKMKPK